MLPQLQAFVKNFFRFSQHFSFPLWLPQALSPERMNILTDTPPIVTSAPPVITDTPPVVTETPIVSNTPPTESELPDVSENPLPTTLPVQTTTPPASSQPSETNQPQASDDGSANYIGERQEQTIVAYSVKKAYSKKPFLLNAQTSGDGVLSYTSSNPKIVSVSADGQVSIKGYGVAQITIIASQTDMYNKALKEISVTIVPAKVKIKAAKSPAKGRLKFKWKKIKSMSGYQYKLKGKGLSIKKTTKKVMIQGGGQSGAKYVIQVRAYKKVGSKKYYGAWSKKKTVRAK